MPEPIILTDANLDTILNGSKPALILVTTGEGLRGDFRVAYEKSANETKGDVLFAKLDPRANPRAAEVFGVGEKPILVAWYCGQEVVRRARPWGTDLPSVIEMLEKAVGDNPMPVREEIRDQIQPEKAKDTPVTEQTKIVHTAPVAVTDATFEQEVLNSDLPVLIDFWAAWCGPCRMVAPILDKLAEEFAGQIKIAKVDVDANPALSQAFRIQSIPNMMIVKSRTMIFNQPGALPETALRQLITQAIEIEIPPQNQPAPELQEEQEEQG